MHNEKTKVNTDNLEEKARQLAAYSHVRNSGFTATAAAMAKTFREHPIPSCPPNSKK